MKKLLEIMRALRDPEKGCPWDLAQTFETIVPYTLEEAYEVADAIEQEDMHELKMELGDLLFQVVFYAQMAKEQGEFEFDDIVEAVCEKLIRRHPHVFESADYKNEVSLHEAWEKEKEIERDKRAEGTRASILQGVAKALPSLKRAQKLQKRAARAGFDWPDSGEVIDKIEEEVRELHEAIQAGVQMDIAEEMGDLLFSCVNLSRHLDVDAEEALRQCNEKFTRRFTHIERHLAQNNKTVESATLDELEKLWQQAKKVTE